MTTKINPKDIKATDRTLYGNLGEEILGIKSGISSTDTAVGEMSNKLTTLEQKEALTEQKITTMDTELVEIRQGLENINQDVETVQEVVIARDTFPNLDSRLDHIEGLFVSREPFNLSTERSYTYDLEGNVQTERITGDLDYLIVYSYNAKGDLEREEHFQDGESVGSKQFIYDEIGSINKIVSINADVMELVTQKGIYEYLCAKVEEFNNLNIAYEIDHIKQNLLIDEYDGDNLLGRLEDFSVRLQVVEGVMPGEMERVLKISEIQDRIAALEMALSSSLVNHSFLYEEGQNIYTLPKTVTSNNLKLFIEGVHLTPGEDYVLQSDRITIEFLVPVITGYRISCEYY